MRQERKIGEVFEYNGDKIIVKKGSDTMWECDKCYFDGKTECRDCCCISYFRQDNQDVHFEKVKEEQ